MGGGGAERQLAYLAKELVELGWEVHVALVSGGPNMGRLKQSGAILHRIHAGTNYDPRLLWRVTRLMHGLKPDLVQVWMLQMEVIGAVAASLNGIPLIWSERCSEEAYPPTLKNRMRVAAARSATAVIANSLEGCDYWSDRLHPDVRRHVIPNAVPLAEIEATPMPSASETGVADGELLILFAGRLTEQKDPQTFLHALVSVLKVSGRTAVVAGSGPLEHAMKDLAKSAGIEGRVRFAGYLENIWSWLKRADVFVSPSLFEGHPNTVIEAAACRCPVVISDIAAHRGFLDETAALLVAPRDAAALAAAIERTLRGGEDVHARIEEGARRVAGWSTREIGYRYDEVYRDLLSSRSV
jgi:glycosyltransferase involved in cell wall biosynthesis